MQLQFLSALNLGWHIVRPANSVLLKMDQAVRNAKQVSVKEELKFTENRICVKNTLI